MWDRNSKLHKDNTEDGGSMVLVDTKNIYLTVQEYL